MTAYQPTENFTKNTSGLSDENFAHLENIMYAYNMAAGSHLYWEGDTADKLYYIKQGRIKITKSTDDGKQLILYLFREGDLFGQFDGSGHAVHTFNAEVMDDSSIGVIQLKDLEVLLWQHGDLAVEFMKWMGLMHRMTESKFRDLLMFGKPGALCSTLIRLSNTCGKPAGSYVEITKKITNSELAEMIGATRESVNRILSDLKKEGIIAMENGHIVIQDLHYLRELCQCGDCPASLCRL